MGVALGVMLVLLGGLATFTSLDRSLVGAEVDTVGGFVLGAGVLVLLGALAARVLRRQAVEREDDDVPAPATGGDTRSPDEPDEVPGEDAPRP